MPLTMNGTDEAPPWRGGWSVIARIGDRSIAFPAHEIAVIAPVPPLWRPPTAPKPVFGFLPIAGTVMPVLNGGLLLGLPVRDRVDFYAHILIMPGLGREGAGLLVDRAEDMVAIDPGAILPLDPADTLNGCAVALVEAGREHVHLLAPSRLLAAAEAAALAELQDEAMRRQAEWQVPA